MSRNRLAKETSPYLLQHSSNPVDWYPWGDEALTRARQTDRPILLSIGYSACHWCHVMEKESFEDEKVARFMNANFVNIKVDREERPDLDSVYMEAVQALTGSGGWPMTVFLTPDGRPFFGGTYFPPEERHGMPSFRRVLESVLETYTRKRGEVESSAKEILESLRNRRRNQASVKLESLPIDNAFLQLSDSFDNFNGGFGRAPKFPQPTTLELLTRIGMKEGFKHANRMVELTLVKMAKGGIFDHLGGGFHRYSVDSEWLVPHFEKMLYDNALLVGIYLHQFQITGDKLYKDIVEQTLDYILREMTHPLGGFYSSQDADSEGVEGKSYVWSLDEIIRLLGDHNGSILSKYFGVTGGGNFEGKNIIRIPEEDDKVASTLGMKPEELMSIISNGKRIMLSARENREQPQRDDKILTSWNGLMLSSLSESSSVLGEERFQIAAEKNATFLMNQMRKNGHLLHSWKDGRAKVDGFLEDYAFLANGLIDLYQTTFEPRWLGDAISLGEDIIDLFLDKKSGGFFDTSINHEKLFKRPTSNFDSAVPSGGSVAARVFQRLFAFTANERFSESSRSALRSTSNYFEKYPTGMTNWLIALDSELNPPREIAIVGDPESGISREMLSVLRTGYRPNLVVAYQPIGKDYSETIPLLKGRSSDQKSATAYICRNFVCEMPISDARIFESRLSN
jgi:uncharacterized protein YyaL (SSP411 family)